MAYAGQPSSETHLNRQVKGPSTALELDPIDIASRRTNRSEKAAARVLVVAPAWVGDMVMANALVGGLIRRGAVVDFLAPPTTHAIARRMPDVTTVYELNVSHGGLGLRDRVEAASRLRQRRFDWAIVLPNSWKSALVPFLAGIPRRTGFTGEARFGLLNDRRELDVQNLPRQVDRFASLADVEPSSPRLQANPSCGEELLGEFGLDLGSRTLVALCPGAEYGPSKRWPAERFAELARRLAGAGAAVCVLGGVRDAESGATIAGRSPALDLTGKTGLDEVVDILSRTSAAVTNDSGLMHVAAALDVPVVGIYGSTTASFTPPLAARAVTIGQDLPCRPCFKRECPLGHLACLTNTSAQRVMDALHELGVVGV